MKTAESIVNALNEPILLLDSSLHAILANPAFFSTLKIPPDSLSGVSVQDLLRISSSIPAFTTALAAVVSDSATLDGLELECHVPQSENVIFLVTARRVQADDSGRILVLVELRNITLQRATERILKNLSDAQARRGTMLELTNHELEAFTHSASHDLKTPLRLTNKIAHLLLAVHGAEMPAGAREKVEVILRSTEEMGKLIEDLLRFSQVYRVPMKKQKVDVKRLVDQVCHDVQEEVHDRAIRLHVEQLPSCHADQALLRQVFVNLLSNALKFTRTREHPEIRIGALPSGGTTTYFVRDNGSGFSMSDAETIFLAFHRIVQVPRVEGSGVGLALVKRIVERHGGRAWAIGCQGKGATIYFTLAE